MKLEHHTKGPGFQLKTRITCEHCGHVTWALANARLKGQNIVVKSFELPPGWARLSKKVPSILGGYNDRPEFVFLCEIDLRAATAEEVAFKDYLLPEELSK